MVVHLFNALVNATRTAERIERKFYVTPKQVDMARGLLRQICRPDGEYPTGLVNSLYFDTFDLDEHQNSMSGDFRKDKVRIRWYDDDGCPDGARTIYVELKSKQGFAGIKRRLKMEVPAYRLTMPHLARGIVPKALLSNTLSSFGYFPSKPLCPVVKITYWRYRFTEPLTGQRVALDFRIRSTMVRPRPGIGEKELELAGAVVEIKGTSIELPATLRRIGMLDVDWSRFSKYSACIDAHDERLGSIGRLSPSGRVIW
ncbi:MAG: VTC domain-containing protein [Chloroflexi bacterium]|nr:VTC domain-containing protein [Chloroflexota bacterium]